MKMAWRNGNVAWRENGGGGVSVNLSVLAGNVAKAGE